MSDIKKLENRIMGDYSIAKSFKGILRIAHILELVKNEKDFYKNPTYYGRPSKLMNISGGSYESEEIGFPNPSKGLDGTITRYSNSNSEIEGDDLKVQRVPMTDSMGNYMNWNIGFDGVTIGSNEDINSTSIEIEKFTQKDFLTSQSTNDFIWQKKYFPVLESGEIIIGLNNKEYTSDKYRVNKESGLVIENKKNLGKLVIENRYDKSSPQKTTSGKYTFINYNTDATKKFRTIYSDDKSSVEDFDVFMYRQDNYDCKNYNFKTKIEETPSQTELKVRGNDIELNEYQKSDEGSEWTTKKKVIDCNVGVVNLKNYVQEVVQKYLGSQLVEVPTGTIINQFCSLQKWYAYPDDGTKDDLTDSSFPGHRPAMMAKRDVGMLPISQSGSQVKDIKNAFVQSTILGASKDINKLLNTNYDFTNKEQNNSYQSTDLTYSVGGFHKEIIPLYKRDYVLCDGSVYAIWVFPKNFITNSYPNRREALDRFQDLFFSIGYEYTLNKEYVNKRFEFEWFANGIVPAYKIVRSNTKETDNKSKGEHLVTSNNCHLFRKTNGDEDEGFPRIGGHPTYLTTDKNALFVEDFITILAFEKLYEMYSKAGGAGIKWDVENINEWFSTVEIPEKYKLASFIGDGNSDIYNSLNNNKWIDRTSINAKSLSSNKKFVMELPYYNFIKEGDSQVSDAEIANLPLIKLGREVKTFGDPIKFWDENIKKWVIVEAYKIPQIQYMIDLFSHYPTPDTLADCLNVFYQYNFQVPNICGNVPTFIGSSGIDWSDTNFRKLRQIESWTCNYSQYDYMHRHFIFMESSKLDPASADGLLDAGNFINGPKYGRNSIEEGASKYYKSSSTITANSYVAAANYAGGSIGVSETYDTGSSGHINYIWNELGAGNSKKSNITLENCQINDNGTRYPILQNKGQGVSWTTGDYRFSRTTHDDDLRMTQTSDNYRKFGTPWWSKSDITEFLQSDRDAKLKYEQETGWYGWEHPEDPRFESFEPNRGRTSTEKNQKIYNDSVSYIRYEKNKESFNITLDPVIKEAEWFSPENIKMLPLIKL